MTHNIVVLLIVVGTMLGLSVACGSANTDLLLETASTTTSSVVTNTAPDETGYGSEQPSASVPNYQLVTECLTEFESLRTAVAAAKATNEVVQSNPISSWRDYLRAPDELVFWTVDDAKNVVSQEGITPPCEPDGTTETTIVFEESVEDPGTPAQND